MFDRLPFELGAHLPIQTNLAAIDGDADLLSLAFRLALPGSFGPFLPAL